MATEESQQTTEQPEESIPYIGPVMDDETGDVLLMRNEEEVVRLSESGARTLAKSLNSVARDVRDAKRADRIGVDG